MAANFDSEIFSEAVRCSLRHSGGDETKLVAGSFALEVFQQHRCAALGDAYGLRDMARRYLMHGLPASALREDLQIAAELIALAAGPRVLKPEEVD